MKLRSELNKRLWGLSEATEWLREQSLSGVSLETIELLQELVASDRQEHQSMLDSLNAGNLVGKASPLQNDSKDGSGEGVEASASPFIAIQGKWPGSETTEELLKALDEMNGKGAQG